MAKLRSLSITSPLVFALPFKSEWAQVPIDLDAPLSSGAWDDSGTLKFSRGFVLAKNDARFLYLALDVVADTGNDPSTNDYFWLTFDVNRDRAITSNSDVNYGLYPGKPNKLGKQKYLGPGRWTGLLPDTSLSEVRQEFGSSMNSSTSHRIWKFKIDLSEINVAISWPLSTPYTYFGFRVKSSSPAFTTDFPSNFYKDFSKLRQLVLSRKPNIPSKDLGPLIGSVGLIPTTKINSSGRATTDAGYFVPAQNAAFGGTLNLIGNQNKIEDLWSSGRKKYQVHITPPGGAAQKLISNWSNYRWNGSTYILETFGPSSLGFYELADPSKDYSIDNLLIQFPTTALLPGLYEVAVVFYKRVGFVDLPDPTASQTIQLYIDNHLPEVNIESIKHGTTEVSACAIETIGNAPDGINFRITAFDPQGNLLGVSFYANYGAGQSAAIFSESYEPSKGNWQGFSDQLIPASGNWRPPQSCAYSFIVSATARTTNGYGYIGRVSNHRNLTLLLG